jgi:hypothetical protein
VTTIRRHDLVRERGGLRRIGRVLQIIAPQDRGQSEHRGVEIEVAWETAAMIDSHCSPDEVEVLSDTERNRG